MMSVVSTIALGAGTVVGAASGAALTGAIAAGIVTLMGQEQQAVRLLRQ